MLKRFTFILLVLFCSFQSDTFKTDQLRYSRVREAYQDKESSMQSLLRKQDLDQSKLNIYLRAFKSDKQLELWGKNAADTKFYNSIKCSSHIKLGISRINLSNSLLIVLALDQVSVILVFP